MWIGNSGSSRQVVHYITGSVDVPLHGVNHDYNNADSLWERMYVNPKPVIIVCAFCKAHNVVTSPCCIQCGAPMGASKEMAYA